jgi:hypothetical protein
VHQPLLRAVMQVPHHAAAGLAPFSEQTRPRVISWSRVSAFAMAVSSSCAN